MAKLCEFLLMYLLVVICIRIVRYHWSFLVENPRKMQLIQFDNYTNQVYNGEYFNSIIFLIINHHVHSIDTRNYEFRHFFIYYRTNFVNIQRFIKTSETSITVRNEIHTVCYIDFHSLYLLG